MKYYRYNIYVDIYENDINNTSKERSESKKYEICVDKIFGLPNNVVYTRCAVNTAVFLYIVLEIYLKYFDTKLFFNAFVI